MVPNVAGAAPEEVADDDDMEEEDEEEMGEEDEMADFIVDEEEVDEHGEPSRYICNVHKIALQYGPVHGLYVLWASLISAWLSSVS